MKFLLVFLGGGMGSLLRFGFSLGIQKTNIQLPLATLIANVVSCLIFGTVVYVFKEKQLVPDVYKYLLLIGICGGLSTFSTFSFETFELLKQGFLMWAMANVVVSVLLCVGLFYVIVK